MKYLFFLAFLLFLSSEVSSQNPNMFEFEYFCYDSGSPACNRAIVDVYEQAGQIISDNLVLNRKIKVEVTIQNTEDADYYGYTIPFQNLYGDQQPLGEIEINYPTALIKQLDPNFDYDGFDISLEINSKHDYNILYYRHEQIHEDQIDFLELLLHELQHGLGIITNLDDAQGDDLFPESDFTLDENDDGPFTFYSFMETIFDTYLVSLNDHEQINTYVHALNTMAGPPVRDYNNWDDFYNNLRNQQQQQGKTYSRDLLHMATNPRNLGFKPNNADEIILHTSKNPFLQGENIVHLDSDTYSKSPDFLLIPEMEPGKKLEDKIQAYGNAPGGGIGPILRSMLTSLGYQSRINPATKSKRSKPKRIINNY